MQGWGGVNDRFAVGTRNAMEAYLSLLDVVPGIMDAEEKDRNSETLINDHLATAKVTVERSNIEYCPTEAGKPCSSGHGSVDLMEALPHNCHVKARQSQFNYCFVEGLLK